MSELDPMMGIGGQIASGIERALQGRFTSHLSDTSADMSPRLGLFTNC